MAPNTRVRLESANLNNAGVKRTMIFSLLRTLADLRSGRFSLTDETQPVDNPRPLLVLYEEAELFLHPSLQKTLLNALDELSASGSQVVFSTHSPVMIQNDLLDTINIVRKREEEGTTVTQFHRILEGRDPADQSRLTDLQSVSSYIFSEKVVLVEGMSDKIVFEKLCPHLKPEWDFDKQSIPVLNAGGKGDACRFKRFLDDLGIETFVIFDIDAVKQECETVVTTDAALEAVGELNQAVESRFEGSQYSVEELETAVRAKPWTTAFEELEGLKDRMANGGETTDSDAALIEKVLSKCEVENPPNHLWTTAEVRDRRVAVVEELLDENILLLSGELEDYYPCTGGGKREMALEFDPTEHEADEIRGLFHPLDSYPHTDVEEFFTRVFETVS